MTSTTPRPTPSPSATPAPTWRQIAPSHRTTSVLPTVAAALLGTLPMLAQLSRQDYSTSSILRILATGVVVLVLVARRPVLVVLAPVATAVVIATDPDVPALPVLLYAALLAAWALTTSAVEPPFSRLRHPVTLAGAPALIVASVLLLVRPGIQLPALAVVGAALCVAVAATVPAIGVGLLGAVTGRLQPVTTRLGRLGRANVRLVERVGGPLGRAIGAVVMVPAALATTAAWLAHRLTRFDPLDPPVIGATRWVERPGADPRPAHSYAGLRIVDPRGAPRRLHRVGAGLATLAVIAAVPAGVTATIHVNAVDESQCADDRATNPVMRDQVGWPAVGCQTSDFATRGRFDGATVFTFADYTSEWVNERDGIRRTWTPPACDCPRLRVWWFGGSAAWGWWQRDEHTLPSQIARAAWEQGVALDIVNYAMPGWVLGQEFRRFAQLTTEEDLPDLVVFYDGGNELNTQEDRDKAGRGDDDSEISFAEGPINDLLQNGPFVWGLERPRADVAAGTRRVSPEEIATHAMNRYERSVGLTTKFADALGVPAVFLWQPLLPSSPPTASPPAAMPADERAIWKRMMPVALGRLPEGVHDLSDSLDRVDRPVFTDIWHTNEYGAGIVAGEIVRRLGPDLQGGSTGPATEPAG